ncbi:MAG TPA: phosphate acyltransferase PlsX, partial [Anaerolineae bacterium]|nr:phosphate acyltransferase PlsX [Anaerolineae bacterium]
MKIVLDAMGGDHAPEVTVTGGVQAAREFGVEIILVGQEDVIRRELTRHDITDMRLSIVHASQVIEMADKPASAVKEKKDNQMSVGLGLVKEGRADAFVTCGNTGGALAASLFTLGRIPGIRRPALSTVFPTRTGFCFLLDIGANTDWKPEYLQQFGLMGSIYSQEVLGVANPRVGLVSIGEEAGKGSIAVREAYDLLEATPSLHFIGNVEGKDIPAGLADVVVTDGFTGNVIIKLSEGVASLLMQVLEEEIRRRPLAVAGALLAQHAFRAVQDRLDYAEYGGGALLGVDGVVIVGHGRSNAKAVCNAIRVAKQTV